MSAHGFYATERNTGVTGAVAFLDAYLAADDNADFEMRLCASPAVPGETFILASVVGVIEVVLHPREARFLADSAESGLRRYPDDPNARGLPNLILALRAAADKAATPPRTQDREAGDGR